MYFNRWNKPGLEIRNQKLREETYFNMTKKPFKEEFQPIASGPIKYSSHQPRVCTHTLALSSYYSPVSRRQQPEVCPVSQQQQRRPTQTVECVQEEIQPAERPITQQYQRIQLEDPAPKQVVELQPVTMPKKYPLTFEDYREQRYKQATSCMNQISSAERANMFSSRFNVQSLIPGLK